jgi:hypothetical protein
LVAGGGCPHPPPHRLTSPCSLGLVADEPLTCAECGRKPVEDENAEDDWRTYYEGGGDGVTLCPECAEREVGSR